MNFSTKNHSIAVAKGDGIGPEIMDAALSILQAAKAPLETHFVTIGEKVYLEGEPTGITDKTWETIKNTEAFFKAPITTPQGGGFKSLNVTVRSAMGLYANIRPCVSYDPYIATKHKNMDVVIIRENEEDLYAGIEYQQSYDTTCALKIITRQGTEKIIRYAFEYAKHQGRKKVTCFTKDNILKITDGLFHEIFEEIGKEYPEIEQEHWIIDIGTAKLADTPEIFDVIVMPNLYGDILSDVAAQISGSVGLAGSSNIGAQGAMFEAIHGSAPRRAGQNVANPSGLILASVQMLLYLKEAKIAETIHNAWLTTIEEGIHTYDIYKEGISKEKVGTAQFAQAVIERLGKKPTTLKPVVYNNLVEKSATSKTNPKKKEKKQLLGVDIFVEWTKDKTTLEDTLKTLSSASCFLALIANRGAVTYPHGHTQTNLSDTYRCRFLIDDATPKKIVTLLYSLTDKDISFVQCQNLYSFNGKKRYSLEQLDR